MPDILLSERRGAVLHLTLNRPDRRNALNTALLAELAGALEAAAASMADRRDEIVAANEDLVATATRIQLDGASVFIASGGAVSTRSGGTALRAPRLPCDVRLVSRGPRSSGSRPASSPTWSSTGARAQSPLPGRFPDYS